MQKKTCKTITIRLELSEYEKLCRIAKAESRFLSRQAAYWVKHGIRGYTLPQTEKEPAD